MNEFDLIALLCKDLPANASVVTGVGDDCAVLDLGIPDRYLLFKTDAVVAGVHFDDSATPEQIGHKALGRCLSDIAAMGGIPNSAVITLAAPKDFDPAYLVRIYNGLRALAQKHGVAIVGGETTLNPERLLLSVALLGTVEKARCILRKGALAGDALFVTGQLGGSRSGKHLDFEPRLREAQWLAQHFKVHAMIDLSDGLAGDLRHILNASGVGAELHSSAIPISRAAKERARRHSPAPDGNGGSAAEDPAKPAPGCVDRWRGFELLFSVASRDAVPLLDAWKKQFPDLPLSCIGKITATPGLTIRDLHGIRPLTAHGYAHFS